jgi:hypothetical protein
MNIRTLQAAITEAERFLDLARELQAEHRGSASTVFITASRTSGATRRASMDLTRALADLRRPM